MLRRLPFKTRLVIGWVGVVIAPVAAAMVVIIGSHEKASWGYYARALILVGAWVYSIFLLRRMRRDLSAKTPISVDTITDDAILRAIQRGFGGPAYRLGSIVIADDTYDIRFRITGDSRTFGIRIALPSASGTPPWVYTEPDDADDWATMLKIWMDEEILTGASSWAATTHEGGVNYFEVASYGFSRADPGEHARLIAPTTQR